MTDLDESLPRRQFFKAAVAAGGAAALSACLDRAGGNTATPEPVPTGEGPDGHPESQHTWNDYVRTDDHGNTIRPTHHVLLYCDLPGDGPPSEDARETVAALRER